VLFTFDWRSIVIEYFPIRIIKIEVGFSGSAGGQMGRRWH
jgi:hypothetical protein